MEVIICCFFHPFIFFSISALRQNFSNPPPRHCSFDKISTNEGGKYFQFEFTIPFASSFSPPLSLPHYLIQEGDLLYFFFFNGNPFFNLSQIPLIVKVRNPSSDEIIVLGNRMWVSDLGLELTIDKTLDLSLDLVFTFQILWDSFPDTNPDEIKKNFVVLLSSLSCTGEYLLPYGWVPSILIIFFDLTLMLGVKSRNLSNLSSFLFYHPNGQTLLHLVALLHWLIKIPQFQS